MKNKQIFWKNIVQIYYYYEYTGLTLQILSVAKEKFVTFLLSQILCSTFFTFTNATPSKTQIAFSLKTLICRLLFRESIRQLELLKCWSTDFLIFFWLVQRVFRLECYMAWKGMLLPLKSLCRNNIKRIQHTLTAFLVLPFKWWLLRLCLLLSGLEKGKKKRSAFQASQCQKATFFILLL